MICATASRSNWRTARNRFRRAVAFAQSAAHASSRVDGELPVRRQLVFGTDRGNAAARRDDQAMQEQVRMRRHVARSSRHRQDQLVHSITDALAATGAVRFDDIKRYLVERGAGLTSSTTGLQPVEVKTLQHFCQDGAVLRKKSTAELTARWARNRQPVSPHSFRTINPYHSVSPRPQVLRRGPLASAMPLPPGHGDP